jgi:PadR family transcriptional regulator PadR
MDQDNPEVRKFQKELNAGVLSLALLAMMDRATEPMYGYQIARALEDSTGGKPSIKQGTLYPLLRTMEGNGLLESEVEPSVTGPPRRYYRITTQGRETLGRWRAAWEETRSFVDAMLDHHQPDHAAPPAAAEEGNDHDAPQ